MVLFPILIFTQFKPEIGSLLCSQENYAAALEYHQKALKMMKELYGKNSHSYIASNLNNTRQGVTQTLFIRRRAILALNIAPINPAALPKKDTHKSGAPKQAGDDAENAYI